MTDSAVLAGEVLLLVHIPEWEIACCREPPPVGETVTCSLPWSPASDAPSTRRVLWEWTPVTAGDGCVLGGRLTWGAASAWCPAEDAPADPRGGPLVGSLWFDGRKQVPMDLPHTVGTVQRVQVITQAYRNADGRASWTALPGRYRLREAPSGRCAMSPRPRPAAADTDSWERGLLVHLLVSSERT